MRSLLGLFLAGALVGCGGTSLATFGDAGDAGAGDAREGDGGDAAASCPAAAPTAGAPCAPDGAECSYGGDIGCNGYWTCAAGAWRHDFPGAACAVDAGPPRTCFGTPSGVIHRPRAPTCSSNAGADAGCNVVPHDACLTDSDCGPGNACDCQAPIPAGQACPGGVPLPTGNACVAADCHTDADCAPCGVCEAEYACGQITGWHCQTPNDACYPSSSSYSGNGCTFRSGKWTPSSSATCPG